MKTTLVPTNEYYHRIIAAPDAATRLQLYLDLFVAPWQQMMGAVSGMLGPGAADDPLAGARAWGWLLPEQLQAVPPALLKLDEANAWTVAARALQQAAARFEPHAAQLPIDSVEAWLVLADPARSDPIMSGYTGAVDWFAPRLIGQYDTPTPHNLHSLPGLVAHEMHHLIRLRLFPWNMAQVTVADYIVHEGLAESFAVALFGEDVLGPYVTALSAADRDAARHAIGQGLQRTGFDVIRAYIFGEHWARKLGLPDVGVPAYGGYATGYHVVQAFLKRSGATIEQATFLPAGEIVAQSGYFGANSS